MGRDLALLIPEIAVLLAAVSALIAEILRRPRASLALAMLGLFVATGLTIRLVGTDTTVFGYDRRSAKTNYSFRTIFRIR